MFDGLLILVIVLALVFDFINGFNDTANAISTVVSTRVLTPRVAIAMAAVLNMVGAFIGTHVAKTDGADIVDTLVVTQWVVLSALLGAITWNLLTWYFAIPSSSSHALIGGIIGATLVVHGPDALKVQAIVGKVLIPLVMSPTCGLVVGFLLMTGITWAFVNVPAPFAQRLFRRLQMVSGAFIAFSHGSNDAQKSMGIITMALISAHRLNTAEFEVPKWVIISCACAMALGTASGGMRIIKTMGTKIFKLQPVNGFAADMSSSLTILCATYFGAPVSTTHVIAGSIMGVGATRRLSAVRWGVAQHMVTAWVLTIPASATMAALVCYVGTAVPKAMAFLQ